ncbi:MAG TPA: hypothetical protein VGI97_06990 [Gemmatimonadaceae bacterium]|jgi:hypothetical protein
MIALEDFRAAKPIASAAAVIVPAEASASLAAEADLAAIVRAAVGGEVASAVAADLVVAAVFTAEVVGANLLTLLAAMATSHRPTAANAAHPDDTEILAALSSFYRESGNDAEAKRYAEQFRKVVGAR